MIVEIDSNEIEKMTHRGVLAYVAVRLADGSEASTSALASIVRCGTPAMLEGLKEISALGHVTKQKNKWICGSIREGEGVILQDVDPRRADFVDDLKLYWDSLNPGIPFTMDARDGAAVKSFLSRCRDWNVDMWRQAMRNRWLSVVRHSHASKSERIFKWVGRLDEYSGGPLNQYRRPVDDGTRIEQQNASSAEEYLARRNRSRG